MLYHLELCFYVLDIQIKYQGRSLGKHPIEYGSHLMPSAFRQHLFITTSSAKWPTWNESKCCFPRWLCNGFHSRFTLRMPRAVWHLLRLVFEEHATISMGTAIKCELHKSIFTAFSSDRGGFWMPALSMMLVSSGESTSTTGCRAQRSPLRHLSVLVRSAEEVPQSHTVVSVKAWLCWTLAG